MPLEEKKIEVKIGIDGLEYVDVKKLPKIIEMKVLGSIKEK